MRQRLQGFITAPNYQRARMNGGFEKLQRIERTDGDRRTCKDVPWPVDSESSDTRQYIPFSGLQKVAEHYWAPINKL